MALRVLLADESSTIKKVMQLALSDFGVEVKAVPVGLDVLSVTKSFKPEIIFADVLLTKRSGYEVCADIKNDPETAHIPVVLMWSGFMEIDEAKATECRADRRLEKPFDADHLRSIVTDLVQKTKSNPISNFLSFPEMPEFEETPTEQSEDIYAIPEAKEEGFAALPEIESAEAHPLEVSGEEFSAVPLTTPKAEDEHDEGGWAHQDLTKFKINLPETESNDFASKFVIPQDDELSQAHIEMDGDFEEISFAKPEPSAGTKTKIPADSFVSKVEKSVKEQMMETLQKGTAKTAASNAQPNTQSKVDLNANMMEKIVREEAREVIESICWKVLPEIAERVIREEINKILRETEKSI
ncbi:response regulator [Bdellovibrio sp. 22V]|uniref:response regulator n=1 Tax=Bdellovibrio TaxID=958 RepID=UPI002543BADE|nr:response regulator [Bdellovibrio sp. 22V]WII72276.1 response regulator [Bdellovibrio sp. 22V]